MWRVADCETTQSHMCICVYMCGAPTPIVIFYGMFSFTLCVTSLPIQQVVTISHWQDSSKRILKYVFMFLQSYSLGSFFTLVSFPHFWTWGYFSWSSQVSLATFRLQTRVTQIFLPICASDLIFLLVWTGPVTWNLMFSSSELGHFHLWSKSNADRIFLSVCIWA